MKLIKLNLTFTRLDEYLPNRYQVFLASHVSSRVINLRLWGNRDLLGGKAVIVRYRLEEDVNTIYDKLALN